MAQSFGVASYSALEAKHLSLFKKYLHNVISDWEDRGDMDYNKQLGMYVTRPELTGTVTANLGSHNVTLSVASDFYAVGCDLQINDKVYVIQQMVSTTQFRVWPAYQEADTTTARFAIRYNRFPTPPLFKKVTNRRLIYLEQITNPHYILERDFQHIPKDNLEGYPLYYQIKYSARQAGYVGSGTVSGSTLTVTAGTLTDEMANMPIRFVGTEELYYLRAITAGGAAATLDRDIATAITVAVQFEVVPEGTFFIEIYPHPNTSKQIIYDYVQTEAEKASVNHVLLAPATVIEAGLDVQLSKFSEESAAARQVAVTVHEARKDAAKMKTVTDFTPTLHYLGQGGMVNVRGLSSYPYAGYTRGRSTHRRS
jgi:hypothetical protein